VTDDRQTDHATEKCVAIGEIACARTISPDSYNNRKQMSPGLVTRCHAAVQYTNLEPLSRITFFNSSGPFSAAQTLIFDSPCYGCEYTDLGL